MSDTPIIWVMRNTSFTFSAEHDVSGTGAVKSNTGALFTPDRVEVKFRRWGNEATWELDLAMIKGTTIDGVYQVATFATHTLERMPRWAREHVERARNLIDQPDSGLETAS